MNGNLYDLVSSFGESSLNSRDEAQISELSAKLSLVSHSRLLKSLLPSGRNDPQRI